MKRLLTAIIFVFASVSTPVVSVMAQDLAAPGKQHLANIKQLTSGGDNAEAYFSFDNKKIVFTSNRHDAQPGDTNVFIADRVNRISLHT